MGRTFANDSKRIASDPRTRCIGEASSPSWRALGHFFVIAIERTIRRPAVIVGSLDVGHSTSIALYMFPVFQKGE